MVPAEKETAVLWTPAKIGKEKTDYGKSNHSTEF